MTNLERLKLQLSNKKYYADNEYNVFLNENGLIATEEYNKADNEIKLLETVVNILETLKNDVDIMRKLGNTDIVTVGQAYKFLDKQVQNLNSKIIALKEEEEQGQNIRPLWFN